MINIRQTFQAYVYSFTQNIILYSKKLFNIPTE